jgi:hypothetical protein
MSEVKIEELKESIKLVQLELNNCRITMCLKNKAIDLYHLMVRLNSLKPDVTLTRYIWEINVTINNEISIAEEAEKIANKRHPTKKQKEYYKEAFEKVKGEINSCIDF